MFGILSVEIQYLCKVRYGLHWAHAPNITYLLLSKRNGYRANGSVDETSICDAVIQYQHLVAALFNLQKANNTTWKCPW